MQSEDDKELHNLQEENKHLHNENNKLKTILESFSIKAASSLQLQEHSESETLLSNKDVEIRSKQKINDRVRLFRGLFRGREDIYAIRWENRSGKSGYSPACSNEWDQLLCRKPCSKCPNSSYMRLTDKVIEEHLAGKKTVGTYPLLTDETCYFLVADFDKKYWLDDIRAFQQSCRDMNVPTVIERSRSGQGGHVWIFFQKQYQLSWLANLVAQC